MTRLEANWTPLVVATFAFALVVAVGAAGCGTGEESGGTADSGADTSADADVDADVDVDTSSSSSLVDHQKWSPTGAADDPLASHRPQSVDCAESAVEAGTIDMEPALSVHTAQCNYLSRTQTLQRAVEKGEELNLRIFRSALDHDTDAEAHVAVLIDGSVVWEKRVAIPASESDLYTKRWNAASAYSKETPVTLHLHNHGSNTWSFIELSTSSP